MKTIKNCILFCCAAFLFAACTNGNPNDQSDVPNSTSSGSYSAGNSDSTNHIDTLAPVQPGGIDSTAGQTNRMSNTTAGASQPKKTDSNAAGK